MEGEISLLDCFSLCKSAQGGCRDSRVRARSAITQVELCCSQGRTEMRIEYDWDTCLSKEMIARLTALYCS